LEDSFPTCSQLLVDRLKKLCVEIFRSAPAVPRTIASACCFVRTPEQSVLAPGLTPSAVEDVSA
jgi:hypothetical protein